MKIVIFKSHLTKKKKKLKVKAKAKAKEAITSMQLNF